MYRWFLFVEYVTQDTTISDICLQTRAMQRNATLLTQIRLNFAQDNLTPTHFFFYKQLGFQYQPGVANGFCQNEAQSC